MDTEKLAKVRESVRRVLQVEKNHGYGEGCRIALQEALALLDEEQPAEGPGWSVQGQTVCETTAQPWPEHLADVLARQALADLLVALRPLASILADPNSCAEDWEEYAADFLRFLDSVGVDGD